MECKGNTLHIKCYLMLLEELLQDWRSPEDQTRQLRPVPLHYTGLQLPVSSSGIPQSSINHNFRLLGTERLKHFEKEYKGEDVKKGRLCSCYIFSFRHKLINIYVRCLRAQSHVKDISEYPHGSFWRVGREV